MGPRTPLHAGVGHAVYVLRCGDRSSGPSKPHVPKSIVLYVGRMTHEGKVYYSVAVIQRSFPAT